MEGWLESVKPLDIYFPWTCLLGISIVHLLYFYFYFFLKLLKFFLWLSQIFKNFYAFVKTFTCNLVKILFILFIWNVKFSYLNPWLWTLNHNSNILNPNRYLKSLRNSNPNLLNLIHVYHCLILTSLPLFLSLISRTWIYLSTTITLNNFNNNRH